MCNDFDVFFAPLSIGLLSFSMGAFYEILDASNVFSNDETQWSNAPLRFK